MNTISDNGIAGFLRNTISLPSQLESLSARYKTAKPFPHIVLDDLFPSALLDSLVAEIPPLKEENWVREDSEQLLKFNLRSAVYLGDGGFHLASFLHSAGFLYFLSELTGIWDLLPDPYLQGSGYHVVPVGGKFDIHCDRNTAYSTGLTRRLSLNIYLNKGWKHQYGGQLELWNHDASSCEVVVEPVFNRTIIFEIADGNFHGLPTPVACPRGQSRNSFAVYYHTVGLTGHEKVASHGSLYAPSIYQRKRPTMRDLGRDFIPPIVRRTLRKFFVEKK
jgi:2OG-Fe(II) oxygenase superfamily